MDPFRTPVSIPVSAHALGYNTPCLLMGSCFSDAMGNKMAWHKLPVLLNPFGTLFNPASLAMNLSRLISGRPFETAELVYHNNLWISLNHYTGFSRPQQHECLANINRSFELASDWLRKAGFLIVTFGTAWVFEYKPTRQIVANCHKIPSGLFNRRMMTPFEIIAAWDPLLVELNRMNPGIQVIFTVSPVRHLGQGAPGNQLSKSVLHCSVHSLLEKYPFAGYFPAYEIFMDELRDYRFYATDMIHPADSGIDYTWQRFAETYIREPDRKTMAGVAAVKKAVAHRPVQFESTNHKTFEENTLKQIAELQKQHPWLDFTQELAAMQLK